MVYVSLIIFENLSPNVYLDQTMQGKAAFLYSRCLSLKNFMYSLGYENVFCFVTMGYNTQHCKIRLLVKKKI